MSGDPAREMTLLEWCAKLPDFHLVNKELKELLADKQQAEAELASIKASGCPNPDPCKEEIDRLENELAEATKQNCQNQVDFINGMEKLRKELAECNDLLEESCNNEARVNDYVEKVDQELAEAKRRLSQITHCENCGGSWVDDGIQAGCACVQVAEALAEAKEENERLRGDLEVLRPCTIEDADQQAEAELAEARAENERLKKRLEKALGALAWYGDRLPYLRIDDCYDHTHAKLRDDLWNDRGQRARAVININQEEEKP